MTAKKWIYILTAIGLISLISVAYYFVRQNPRPILIKTSYRSLPNWKKDNFTESFSAFKKSCTEILSRDPNLPFGATALSGKNSDWQTICAEANKLKNTDSSTTRHFFETWFTPYRISNNFHRRGLFTGYYLPLINGRLKPNKQYSVPIYAVPPDLIKINLGLFNTSLSGKTVIGQIKQQTLLPYPDRAAISHGAIPKNTPVLAWSDSVLDVFFAQIQGSAIVRLPNHQQFIISYATHNGQPYTAIGKVLIQNKALTKQTISMQTIRQWLQQHPEQMDAILNHNASYVFFNALKNKDPVGAEHIPLTPQRSLAVDTRYIPLGTPIWLDTSIPQAAKKRPFQQMLIAQDTGGAIKGIVRGDVYWGAGKQAALIAGQMQQSGRYWVLLPKKIPQ